MKMFRCNLALVILLNGYQREHTIQNGVKCESVNTALAFALMPTNTRSHRYFSSVAIKDEHLMPSSSNRVSQLSNMPFSVGVRERVSLAQYIGEGPEDSEDSMNRNQSSEPVYYDDFDFSPGTNSNVDANVPQNAKEGVSEDSETQSETLSTLFQKSRDEDEDRNARIIQNWENGNWKCRGFSLDKFNPVPMVTGDSAVDDDSGDGNDTTSGAGESVPNANNNDIKIASDDEQRIEISQITFDETALGPGFGTTSETIAVGRTDGTVYIVQLGDEYLTKFKAVPKVSIGGNWDDEGGDEDGVNDAASSAKIEMEMVNQEELKERMGGVSANDDLKLGADVSLDGRIPNDVSTPFDIDCQFQAHGRGEAISALLFHDDTLFTSANGEGMGAIKVWKMHGIGGSSTSGTRMMPNHILDGAHKGEVIALKTLSSAPSAKDVSDHNLLLSASKDGSFAMWDMNTGDQVYKCELLDDDGGTISITCADIDTSSDEHVIYLGLASGHVVGYVASDLIGYASEGNACPVPKCRFLAHDPSMQRTDNDKFSGVTAITCGGPGQMSSTASSSILLTGGADGTIKQYQMIQQNGPGATGENGSWSLAYWPRMPTQRMKDCAHVFENGHYDAVTALIYDGAEGLSKVISSGADGTIRVWNPAKGDELYRMDGFDGVTSLCHDREILVTNGMKEYVCVHDFDVAEDLADSSYDLNW